MKNFPLCTVLLSLLFSCSIESDFESLQNHHNSTKVIKSEITFPLNPANPFDAKGKKYYDAIKVYLKSNDTPNSIEDITSQISFISDFYKINNTNKKANLGFTPEEILAILNDPSNKLLEIVENCSISALSKAELIVFVQALIDQQDEQYAVIRDYIISFDATIIESTTLNADEKETILTVSTISSYALFAEAERKDRDWETSVGTRKTEAFFDYNQAPVVSIIALLKTIF
jgi:hypothetical protein